MAEPEGDLSDVPRRLERVHCAGMAENMGAHPFVGDGRLPTGRGRHMLGEDVLEPRSGHGMADAIEEQFRIATRRPAGEPSLQRGGRFLPQWQYAFPPPLSQHMDAGDRWEIELIQPEADEFRDSQSGRKGEVEHGLVANARSSARIGCIEQSLQLLPRKISDKRLVSLLHRNGVNPTGLVKTGGQPVREEPEERVDRGEPRIARACRVPARGFDMLEESEDERCIELLNFEPTWSGTEPVRREAEQDTEAVSIGFAGVRTGSSLLRQMLAKESCEVWSNRGQQFLRNGTPHRLRRSAASGLGLPEGTSRYR